MRPVLLIALPLLLAGVPVQGAVPATVVDIHLSNFRFAPNVIRLTHGQPYVLRFVNDASGGHNFIAKNFFAATGLDPRTRGLVANGGIELPGGGAVEVRLTAPGAGHYKVKCTHFLHAGFGMKGEIIVN